MQSIIEEATNIFQPTKSFALTEDDKDNYLADLAHQSNLILAGNDKDFDMLRKLKHPKVKVLTIREFYDQIGI